MDGFGKSHYVDILESAAVESLADVVEHQKIVFRGDAEDRVVLAIVVLDLFQQRDVVLDEQPFGRLHSCREIIGAKVYDCYSRL